MEKESYLTEDGLKKIKEELDYLKNVKRKEIAERLRHTASFGDLTENAAYDEAKESQGFLEGRIRELGNLIRNAVIIRESNKGTVQIGSIVEVVKDSNSKKPKIEKFQIVGSAEANPLEGKISADSPLGKSLINKKEGATFFIETPDGKVKHKILRII